MGGSSGDAPQRDFSQEWPDIRQFENSQFGQVNAYGASSPLMNAAVQGALNFYGPILANGGELSPELARSVTQDTRNAFAARGNNYGNQSAVAEVMNREQFREGRVNTALAETTGVQNSLVSQFSSIVDPVLSYLSTLFQGNLAAQVQAQQANQGKEAGMFGGALSGAASIAGKVLPVVLGAAGSDERLKQKIRETGVKTKQGLPVKTFEYKTRPGVRFAGFMSKDVKKVAPEHVFVEPRSGIEFVSERFAPVQIGAMKGA